MEGKKLGEDMMALAQEHLTPAIKNQLKLKYLRVRVLSVVFIIREEE